MTNENIDTLHELTDDIKEELSSLQQEILDIKQSLGTVNQDISSMKREVGLSKNSLSKFGTAVGHIITGSNSTQGLKNLGYSLAKDMLGSSKGDIFSFANNMVSGLLGGARATGGNVGAGTAYLVGENGPEMFIPHTGGYIDNGSSKKPHNIKIEMNINTPDIGSFYKSRGQIINEATSRLQHSTRNL